nr:uncharacterized protein LOC128682524 [Plodia interpunctella]
MRTSRNQKKQNKMTSCLHIAHKTKRRRKFHSNSIIMSNSMDTISKSILNLENINEILRTHKSHRTEGKTSWKLIPKDSREIYKKKQEKNEKSHQSDRTSDEYTEENGLDTHTSDETSDEKEHIKRRRHYSVRRCGKKAKRTKSYTRRRYKASTVSHSSITTEYGSTSCSSGYSDMEYD